MAARTQTPSSPTPPLARQGRIVSSLIAGGIALGVCVVAAAMLVAWAMRERTLAEAGREARNTAFILADHTERAIQAVDLALEATLERGAAAGALASPEAFAAWAGSRAVFDATRDRLQVLPQLDAIILTDRTGIVVGTTRVWPSRRTDNADRDYYRALRDGAPAPYVALPIRSRATSDWVVPIARRVTGTGATFLGVAMGTIQSAYFAGLYDALALGPGVSIALLRDDAVVLARSPAVEGLIGRDVSEVPAFRNAQQQAEGRPVRVVGLDGVERLKVGQKIALHPADGATAEELLRNADLALYRAKHEGRGWPRPRSRGGCWSSPCAARWRRPIPRSSWCTTSPWSRSAAARSPASMPSAG